MKKYISIALLLSLVKIIEAQTPNEYIVTSDIDNFWIAYDKIRATKDSAEQYTYLHHYFLDKGTPGLSAIMEARNYTDRSYINAIHVYPYFWQSIRPNTLKAKEYANQIEKDIIRLKEIYPDLRPAKIYFTIGALRTGGTTLNGLVLIGSEIAMADSSIIATEFGDNYSHLPSYFKSNPIQHILFNNVHEYVHTQQKNTVGNHLLAQCVLEGVAEFVAVKATGKPSPLPAMRTGKKYYEKIREQFTRYMFNPFEGFWLYSNEANEFDNARDLGYYVGYEICEHYYNQSADKKKAIKEMIELDYNNEKELALFVNQSGYFTKPIKNYQKQFEEIRPKVLFIAPFPNGNKKVKASVTQLSITFTEEMDIRYRNFEYGPLGESNVLPLEKFVGFSTDGKTVTFDIKLEPNKQYQIIVGNGFVNKNGISLKPYLIDFTTDRR